MITQTACALFCVTLINFFMSTRTAVAEHVISHDFKLQCLQLKQSKVITFENIESIFSIDSKKLIMNRIGLIDGYDEKTVRESLNLVLRDRKNEFRELAESLKIPRTTDDWEVIILKFCLDFEDCFRIWTDAEEPNSVKNNKCMTIMREISRGKKNLSEVIHLQNIAQTLYTEFHPIYKRVS